MSFGFPINEEKVCYWGARAIYRGYTDGYRVDLLFDRQSAEDASEEFVAWVNDRALPWLRAKVKSAALSTDSTERLEFQEFKYILRATPNGSYGYLYIGAAELKVEECPPFFNDATLDLPAKSEPAVKVGDKKYVFDGEIPPIGTKVKVTVNQLGTGTVVGYHAEEYGGDYHLLSLKVELDDPPKWWVDQSMVRAKAEFIKQRVWMLKPKFEKCFHEAEPGRTMGIARNLAEVAPSKLFNKDGMAHWREWKENYENPVAVIWDGDFTLFQEEIASNG